MHTQNKRALGISALALASTLALAGCASPSSNDSSGSGMSGMAGMGHGSGSMTSDSTTASPSSAAAFNDADVMFAQMMIPHHQQAIEMSDMILAKSGIDPKVTALAKKIKAAQQPEIERMRSWLSTWGKPAPSSSSGMSGMGSDGMMSSEDMTKLQSADGAAASKLFLTQMITHHQGAITMAKAESADGSATEAMNLAASIITSQIAEITEMKSLLASL